MNRGATGAASELIVAADLLRRGFEVFRAVGAHSTCDLIYLDAGAAVKVEVRTTKRRADGTIQPTTHERDDCDIYAFVCDDGIEYMPAAEIEGQIRLRRGFRRGALLEAADAEDVA